MRAGYGFVPCPARATEVAVGIRQGSQWIGRDLLSRPAKLAGTGADAISIDATAGSMLIAPSLADEKTLTIGNTSSTYMLLSPDATAADEKILIKNALGDSDAAIKLWSAAGGITLLAANASLHIEADGTDTDAINIDSAGGIDVDAAGALAIDSVGLSIDSAGVAANITSTTDGAAEDFTIEVAGATDSSLILKSSISCGMIVGSIILLS